MGTTLLTGAGGFIGSHIAEHFAARGVSLRCLVRDMRRAEFLRTLDVEIVAGDVTHPATLADAVANVDTIIHTAARVADWGAYHEFHTANVVGTVAIMRIAAAAGIRHVILTGSNACYGEDDTTEVKTEASPYRPHARYAMGRIWPSAMNHYRETKTLACLHAIALARRYAIDLTIIDPVWVYGEREFSSGFHAYVAAVAAGARIMPGSRTNRFHTIYARDLAQLFLLAREAHLPGVERLLACDTESLLQCELFDMFCEEAGLAVPHRLSRGLALAAGFTLEAAAALLHLRTAPPLTRARAHLYYDNIICSGARARDLLGFRPQYTPRESIRRTVRWYIDNNFLPAPRHDHEQRSPYYRTRAYDI